ncbi:MAG: hypothetical protein LQ339_003315 [Xanthoria mediterranea]|nr:MAG: hypothetical protein LQ339_003315 [Xanthoria mediterranea]
MKLILVLSYERLLHEAREHYTNTAPPFTVPKQRIRKGHRYLVWLAGTTGALTERTASTEIYSLTAVEWDQDHCFWTIDVGAERWIVASLDMRVPLHGKPQHHWPIPYRRWVGAGMSETGFSISYVAYWSTAKPTSLSRPEDSTVAAATNTLRGVPSANSVPAILHPYAPSAPISEQGPSYTGNARRPQPILGSPTTNRKKCPRLSDEGVLAKRTKASDLPVRTVAEIIQRDRVWYGRLGTQKPPFVTRKNSRADHLQDVSQFTAFEANDRTEGSGHRRIIQARSRDYSPAYRYWVAKLDGHEQIVIRSPDQKAGFCLRVWGGHEYGIGDMIVAYGRPPTRDLGALSHAPPRAASPSGSQDPKPSEPLQSKKTQSPQAEPPLAQEPPITSEPETPSDTDSFATCRSTFSRKSSDPTNPPRRRQNLWKNTQTRRESSAPRPSTPDMSVFVEPLTPPATSPNMWAPTRDPAPTWSVASRRPVALQPQWETAGGGRADFTPRIEGPMDQYRVGERMVPGHVPPSNPRTNFNLPPLPHDQYPLTTPPVIHPTYPEPSLSSLIEQSRARTYYAQLTQARKEQFAELNDIEDDEKRLERANGV